MKKNQLEANADKIEDFSYFKEYESSELEKKREDKIRNDLKLRLVKLEIKEFKDVNQKPLEKANDILLNEIESRGRTITEKCYLIANRESEMMEYFNNEGEMIHSRKLLPEERQLNIQISKVS